MWYYEEKQNLFSMPSSYMKVHCVSADYALGAGIAKEFARTYNAKWHLCARGDRYQWDGHGRCAILELSEELNVTKYYLATHHIASLITKECYWHKPTLRTIEEALLDLKNQLQENYPIENGSYSPLAMPKIGCGLDQLNWSDVSEIVQNVFRDMHIEICVCTIGGVL